MVTQKVSFIFFTYLINKSINITAFILLQMLMNIFIITLH